MGGCGSRTGISNVGCRPGRKTGARKWALVNFLSQRERERERDLGCIKKVIFISILQNAKIHLVNGAVLESKLAIHRRFAHCAMPIKSKGMQSKRGMTNMAGFILKWFKAIKRQADSSPGLTCLRSYKYFHINSEKRKRHAMLMFLLP